MPEVKGKLSPRWISGVNDYFDGDVRELLKKLPVGQKGQKPKLFVVVKRYKDTYPFEEDPWAHEDAPLHLSTPSPVPTEAATFMEARPVETGPVEAGPVEAGPMEAGPAMAVRSVRRKRARSPVTTPRRSQRRRRIR